MKATPRSSEQIGAEAQTFLPPETWFEAARSDGLLGLVLRVHSREIPPEYLRWLKGFLRAHLSRPEYRLLSERYGWRKRKARKATEAPKTGAADDPPSAELTDPEIPF
jgi:hypothetical protein